MNFNLLLVFFITIFTVAFAGVVGPGAPEGTTQEPEPTVPVRSSRRGMVDPSQTMEPGFG